MVQLSHNGGVVPGGWSKRPALAPSPVAQYQEPPKALDHDEIDELVAAFAVSAANCAAAGLDGVEIHAAHGYLIHQFLTPLLNHRTDEFGGSLENRMRFGTRVLEAVRAACSVASSSSASASWASEEMWDGSGLTPEHCAEIGARWAGDGLVDFVNVSVGQSGIGMVRPLYSRRAARRRRDGDGPRRGARGQRRCPGVRRAPHRRAGRGGVHPRARRGRRGVPRPGADRRSRPGSTRRGPAGPRRSGGASAATRVATGT